MGHPLTPDLSKMPIDELTNKYNDLVKRMTTAYRWDNYSYSYKTIKRNLLIATAEL
jgi:hypothetical protein